MIRLPAARLSTLSLPLASSSSSASSLSLSLSFSTSCALGESKAKRKARLSRKAHLESKATLERLHALSAPDPVLGHARGNGDLWAQSLLKRVLLDPKHVWGTTVSVLPDEKTAVPQSTSPSPATATATPAAQSGERLLNFGLDAAEVGQLATALPLVGAYQQTQAAEGLPASEAIRQDRFDRALHVEHGKRDALLRIVDLRNASSKGIDVENTRRIVEAFGTSLTDTGSPEVQAAILTSRIHSLADHLTAQPRDVHNRRPLRSMIQQRAKVLKYLRSLDVARYDVCLAKIGVEPRAVEGEVIVTKQGLRSIIRGV